MPADPAEPRPIAAVAVLEEPTRRRLYDYIARQRHPVSRDQAAEAVDVPRANVAFHLDKLTEAGLLEVTYQRLTGRSGPGAGRTAKLYHRSEHHINVSLPERKYELAGALLAAAVDEAEDDGSSPQEALNRRAHEFGRQLGAAAPGHDRGAATREPLLTVLEHCGFEPDHSGEEITLRNCPFHALAQDHTNLICGMNLRLLSGILDGLATADYSAHLEPSPEDCCVRLHLSDQARNRVDD